MDLVCVLVLVVAIYSIGRLLCKEMLGSASAMSFQIKLGPNCCYIRAYMVGNLEFVMDSILCLQVDVAIFVQVR